MKLISFSLLCMFCILSSQSCKKDTTALTQKLATYEDSMNKYTYVYNGDKITEVHGIRRDGTIIDTPYLEFTYGPNYVRKTRTADFYTEYFLNSYDLPVLIKPHFQTPIRWNPQYRFYYKGSTSLLDSMIANRDYGYDLYIPTYSGNDIIKIKKVSHYSIGPSAPENFSYTYSTTPNVIRKSNPLLYIYNEGNPVDALHLPLIFSGNTLDSFSISPPNSNWGRDRFTFTTNAQNNITSENYGPGNWPYGRIYTYK